MKVTGGAATRTVTTFNTILSGSQTVGVVPAALNNGTRADCFEVLVQSDPENDAWLVVGSNIRQDVILMPGQTETIPINGVSKVSVRARAGEQVVRWHAMR